MRNRAALGLSALLLTSPVAAQKEERAEPREPDAGRMEEGRAPDQEQPDEDISVPSSSAAPSPDGTLKETPSGAVPGNDPGSETPQSGTNQELAPETKPLVERLSAEPLPVEEPPSPPRVPPKTGSTAPKVDQDVEPEQARLLRESSRLRIEGFVQADYVRSQLSEDELADGTGAPLNENRFLVRRGRLTVNGSSDPERALSLHYILETDFNTFREDHFVLRQVQGRLSAWPLGRLRSFPLELSVAAGILPAPFGYEVPDQSDADRWFTERSLMGQAFFPGQVDVGAQLAARLDWTRFGGKSRLDAKLAVQNGEPLATAPFPGADPNNAKDVVGRLSFHTAASSFSDVEVGFSAMRGKGFSSGTRPTKDVLVWRDFNEDGIVQTGELSDISGSAGAPSKNFQRFGLGADLRLFFDIPSLGQLSVFAEGALAENLDRAVRPSDPVFLGRDERQLAYYAGFTQVLFERAVLGLRYDYYRPEIDQTDLAGGVLLRSKEQFKTWTAMVGAYSSFDELEGRLIAEYAHQEDPLGRDASGRPTDLSNDRLVLRAQVRF